MEKWAEHAEAEKAAVKAVVALVNEPSLPELPANLKRCLAASKQVSAKNSAKAKANSKTNQEVVQPKSPSADQLVLAQVEARKKREACADAILKWYERVRGQQKVAEAKK